MANMLQFGNSIPNKPQDNTLSCYYEKPELLDTYINWKRMSASEIIALINTCNRWSSGADATLTGEHIKIIMASLIR
jgi:methionyl-tRNA formyltransferase